jgi:undecaprenyl-diphosphatase
MEMSGGTRIQAVSALAVISVVGFLVHTTLTVWLVAVVGRRSPLHFAPDVDASWPLLAAIIVVSSAAGAAIWYWRLHRRLARLVRSALEGLGSVARRPLRLLLLLASTLGVSVAYAFALDASVIAAGGHLGAGRALTVYFAASAIGALSPTPGGLGTLEAALLAGLSQQGVATGSAVAGVLTYRVITYWLPVLPGLAFLSLLKRRSLL